MNTNIRKTIYLKNGAKNLEFEDENNEYNNFKSHMNIKNNYKLENNILRTIDFDNENNDSNLYNEIKKKNYTIYNVNKNNNNHFNNIKCNQYTNIVEVNQILFISLNNLVKKGYVKNEKKGVNCYVTIKSKDEYLETVLRRINKIFFNGDKKKLINTIKTIDL